MVDGDVLRMSDAADIAELLAAGFARASRPIKVVLQKSSPRPLQQQRRAADAVSEDYKDDAVFANRRGD